MSREDPPDPSTVRKSLIEDPPERPAWWLEVEEEEDEDEAAEKAA